MNVEPEKIHALISILQSMLPSDQEETQEESFVSTKTTKNKTAITKKPAALKTKATKKTKKTRKSFVNKFDQMPEHRMHKEDTLIDKQLNVLPPTPRDRHFQPVTVQCRICGKQETVSPSLIDSQNRYKCNNCCTSSG